MIEEPTIRFSSPSPDQLYRAHARRLEVQEEALASLAGNVERERKAVARARLVMILLWRMDRKMDEAETPAAPACRSSESFCGDTGCEVHGPEAADSGQRTAPESDSGREPTTNSQEPAPGGAS